MNRSLNEEAAQLTNQEIAADLDQFTQNFEQIQLELCPDFRPQQLAFGRRKGTMSMSHVNRTTV